MARFSLIVGAVSVLTCGLFLGSTRIALGEEATKTQIEAWVALLELRVTSGVVRKEAEKRLEAARAGIAGLEPTERALDIVRKLSTGVWHQTRKEGATVAGRMGRRALSLVPLLLENLRDQQIGVQAEAARALGAVAAGSPQSARVVKRLSARLGRSSEKTADLGALGALDGLVLLGALDDDAVTDHLLGPARSQLSWLFRRKPAQQRTIEAIFRARSWHLRDALLLGLLLAISEAKSGAVIDPWRDLLAERLTTDESAAVRKRVLDVYYRAGYRKADVAQDLVSALTDADHHVRGTAYRVADARDAARNDRVADVLLEALKSESAQQRAAAAWILHAAVARRADVSKALHGLQADEQESVRRAAAAALLDAGHSDAYLLDRLVQFIDGTWVSPPYPEPDGLHRGYGIRWDGLYPAFKPSPTWNTGRVRAIGPQLVSRLERALTNASAKDRNHWLHALGHAGPRGLNVLQRIASSVIDREELLIAVIRIHQGQQDKSLLPLLIKELEWDPPTAQEHGSEAWRKLELIKGALAELGALPVAELIRIRRTVPADSNGMLPDIYTTVGDILLAIGKPALPAVERAAADKDTGYRFKRLLGRLRRAK